MRVIEMSTGEEFGIVQRPVYTTLTAYVLTVAVVGFAVLIAFLKMSSNLRNISTKLKHQEQLIDSITQQKIYDKKDLVHLKNSY